MDNQENQEDNNNIIQPKEKRPRGRPRKPKQEPEEPKEPKPLGRPRKLKEPKEPKKRGRPQIHLIKPAYKPKDPDYFKKYYETKTKVKIEERELEALKYFLNKFQNELKNEEKKQE